MFFYIFTCFFIFFFLMKFLGALPLFFYIELTLITQSSRAQKEPRTQH